MQSSSSYQRRFANMVALDQAWLPSPDVADPESSCDWNEQAPQSVLGKERVLAIPWAYDSIRKHNSWQISSEVHIQGLCQPVDSIHIWIQVCQTLSAE